MSQKFLKLNSNRLAEKQFYNKLENPKNGQYCELLTPLQSLWGTMPLYFQHLPGVYKPIRAKK